MKGLAASVIAFDDDIMRKGVPAAAGSDILKGFISPFSATAVDRLSGKVKNIVGNTKSDAFGIPDLFGDSENLGNNPLSPAVKSVAGGEADFALTNDIFGAYRKQAAENGCYYIRPTYGTVSRYGLIPSVSSMDQIGIICGDINGGFDLLSHIAGNDKNDGAMFPEEAYAYKKTDKNLTIGIPCPVKNSVGALFGSGGLPVNLRAVDIELKYFEHYAQVMYILCCAEISNNINRYDGIKYGFRASGYDGLNGLYKNTRSEGFNRDTKLAAVMGCYVLSQGQYEKYYEKALKLRGLIKKSLGFSGYDLILLPCSAETRNKNVYNDLPLYSLAPLAGLPSVSFSYKGGSIQLIADVKGEGLLLSALEALGA